MTRGSKWRTLVIATAGFNLSFLIWFSFAPFAGEIADEFGLSLAEVGVLTSAAVWLAPFGRILTGWLTDRFGAPTVFAFVLAYVGVFSIASAFADSYRTFFVLRLIVATAGITFVVGIQHVSQWFPEEQLGTAEGVYAGFGNAGAAGGALVLPRLFGADWRAAFLWTGVAALVGAVVYYRFGEAAASDAEAAEAAEKATFRGWLHTATRYGVLALSLAYVMSFGLEVAMNGWLPTYFREGFEADLVLASTFAATFSLAAGLLRPLGGFVSDWLVRTERNVLPVFEDRYREQWTFLCLSGIVVALAGLTVAGTTGNVHLTVAAAFLVGTACAWSEGAIFAQVPARFPERTGAAAGVIGGVGTFGGIGYPLVFSAAATAGAIHYGYVAVAATMVPILLVNAWTFRPAIARRMNVAGPVSVGTDASSPVDD
ncbi:MFS transporter [Salinilacihabitans rarus]|uniref:MFS transporter n=1 Tax=Salinilacihabitans rarus TaxID=2961596 RepID=UPI0020C83AD4|nr:MFS transporter [Salinilacihabitans rarus]